MKTWNITTNASTRSKSRQTMNHIIQAETADDAMDEARLAHIQRVGWNASIWISAAIAQRSRDVPG
jgi:hypothetical protein